MISILNAPDYEHSLGIESEHGQATIVDWIYDCNNMLIGQQSKWLLAFYIKWAHNHATWLRSWQAD